MLIIQFLIYFEAEKQVSMKLRCFFKFGLWDNLLNVFLFLANAIEKQNFYDLEKDDTTK